MKCKMRWGGILGIWAVLMAWALIDKAEAAAPQPRNALYVSKLGNNSDGSSWANALTSIQAALDAIPDDAGGYRIIIRPDTYMEANLLPAHKGAEGAYNSIESDFDGQLGSGATGYAIIDCSDSERGLKAVDWWGPFRATPEVSGANWDRWTLRHLYTTGGDAGLFWDLPPKQEPFSVIVEDSIGVGRAFGGGMGNVFTRPGEPCVFRRCHLWALDWWGDTAAAYVRFEDKAMSATPSVSFEDCTLVSPQCSIKSGNPGYAGYTHIKATRCTLATLNFSQPRGTPSLGIVQNVMDGKLMQVDFEDCTLMGYKVFGVREKPETDKDIVYTTAGSCRAYVQFEQEMPKGFFRIGYWPVELFAKLSPPQPPSSRPAPVATELIERNVCELSPVMWQDRLMHMVCLRPASGGEAKDYHLILKDAATGEEKARFAEGYSLGCAFEHDGKMYAFASRFADNNWNDVTVFHSTDLNQWESRRVIEQDPSEHLFNSSVCEAPGGFVMAYETNDPAYPAFTIKFARSENLLDWTKVSGAVFGTDRYTACPCIRYSDGWYYLMYLEHRTPRWFFETYIARSKDLVSWEVSGANPILSPTPLDECINASDPDIVQAGDVTWLYYAVGDQLTWMNIKRVGYREPVSSFLSRWFSTTP